MSCFLLTCSYLIFVFFLLLFLTSVCSVLLILIVQIPKLLNFWFDNTQGWFQKLKTFILSIMLVRNHIIMLYGNYGDTGMTGSNRSFLLFSLTVLSFSLLVCFYLIFNVTGPGRGRALGQAVAPAPVWHFECRKKKREKCYMFAENWVWCETMNIGQMLIYRCINSLVLKIAGLLSFIDFW